MKIGDLRETSDGENRVALTPNSARQIQKLGHTCFIEAGAGAAADFSDGDYRAADVEVRDSADAVIAEADVIAKVLPTSDAELAKLQSGQTVI